MNEKFYGLLDSVRLRAYVSWLRAESSSNSLKQEFSVGRELYEAH
jgi:hypothetical protein